MKIVISIMAGMIALQAAAQNVGIGTNTPIDRMQVHGGAAGVTNISITNDASGSNLGEGMRLGIVYINGNTSFQFGQLSLAKKLPFLIRQIDNNNISRTPLTLDGEGQFGLGSFTTTGFRLAVNGPAVVYPGLGQPASMYIADTVANSGLPVGFGLQKISAGGKHFTTLAQDESKALSFLQSNFKNGSANSRTISIQFDSLGNTGIADVTSAAMPAVRSNFHVFGDQRIEGRGNNGGLLDLHSKLGDYINGSSIRFYYSPLEYLSEPVGLTLRSNYFIKLNDANASTNIAKTFAIGQYIAPFGNGTAINNPGMVLNLNGQVGIRKYPVKSESFAVQVDIEGTTRINGGLVLTGIDEASGKVLVSSATGDATWQNPPKIMLDQSSTTGQSAVEFRNQGSYVGSFGWSQASTRYFLYDGNTGTNPLVIKDGRVGLGDRNPTTNMLEVNGNASKSSAGSWLGNSDARLKKDIQPISGALQKVMQLKGISYQWADNKTGIKRPEGIQMGFTAQNIQQVFPEAVTTDAQGYLQTAYGTYDALLVEAIRELKNENDLLKIEIGEIKRLLEKK